MSPEQPKLKQLEEQSEKLSAQLSLNRELTSKISSVQDKLGAKEIEIDEVSCSYC